MQLGHFATLLLASALIEITSAQVGVSLGDELIATLSPYIYVGLNRIDSMFYIYHVTEVELVGNEAALTHDDQVVWWSVEPSNTGYMSELFSYEPHTGILAYQIFESDE